MQGELVSSEVASSALESHDRHTSDPRREVLQHLVDDGDLRVIHSTFEVTVNAGWLQDHHGVLRSRDDSTAHDRLKIVLAAFLDKKGHGMDRVENLRFGSDSAPRNYDVPEYVYSGANFEQRIAGQRPDVACPDCRTYGEGGKVSPTRVLRAVRQQSVDELVVAPYTGSGGGRTDEPIQYDIFTFSVDS